MFTILLVLFMLLLIIDHSLVYRLTQYIDMKTITILVMLFIVSRLMELSGLVNRVAIISIKTLRGRSCLVFTVVVLITCLVSPLVMNDAAIFIMVPLVIAVTRTMGIDKAFAVTVVALAANIGSMLTPIGNPQNIILWSRFNPGFLEFILYMSLPTILLVTILILYTLFFIRKYCIIEKLGLHHVLG